MVPHTRTRVGAPRLLALALALALSVVSSVLGGAGFAGAARPTAATVIVSADEYSFGPSVSTAPAGRVRFVVHNDGRIEHDFVVLRTDLAPDAIPMKGSSGRPVERGKGVKRMGGIRHIRSGQIKSDTLKLPAGHYVLVCTLAGHYMAGMYSEFVVS